MFHPRVVQNNYHSSVSLVAEKHYKRIKNIISRHGAFYKIFNITPQNEIFGRISKM